MYNSNSNWEKWEVTCKPQPFPPKGEALPAEERAEGAALPPAPEALLFTEALEAAEGARPSSAPREHCTCSGSL